MVKQIFHNSTAAGNGLEYQEMPFLKPANSRMGFASRQVKSKPGFDSRCGSGSRQESETAVVGWHAPRDSGGGRWRHGSAVRR